MSITITQTRTAADLNAAHSEILSDLKDDNQTLPAVYWHYVDFRNITSASSLARRTRAVFLPDDHILAEVVVLTADLDGYLDVELGNDVDELDSMIEQINIYGTQPTGFDKMDRWFASTNTSNPAVQLLLQGSRMEIVVETLSETTPNLIRVGLGLASEWRRI